MEKPAKEFLSLIVPAYNEENRLQTELPHVFEYLRENFSRWEVLYVDDGSTDRTYQELIQVSQNHPEMHVLQLNKNSGKGRAIRTGLQAARGDVILFSDADFSTPIEEAAKLLSFLKNGYDIIIRKLNDTTKLYFKNVHDHNDTLSINQKWKNTITTQTNMEAEIVLYLDHDGHTGSKKAFFKIQ